MPPAKKQLFDYMLVVDFEATCEANASRYPNEIIEFPVVAIDVAAMNPCAEFHSFVRPVRNPKLTEFCTSLTGITQEQVSSAPLLKQVIAEFHSWVLRTFPRGSRLIFATDGPWDLRCFMHRQAVIRDKHVASTFFYRYIDIRTTYMKFFGKSQSQKLADMLHDVGLKFSGRQHSGIDDARNIARLALELMRRGCVFDFICTIKPSSRSPVFPPWSDSPEVRKALAQTTSRSQTFVMMAMLVSSTLALLLAWLNTRQE